MSLLVHALNARSLSGLAAAVAAIAATLTIGPSIAIGGQAPLAIPAVQLAVAVVALGGWVGGVAWSLLRARRSEGGLQALVSGGKTDASDPLARDIADSLKRLRRWAKGDRNYLYATPWYMVVGPPGSGKTCLLDPDASGLTYRDPKREAKHRGLGGTRHCDWWFAQEAVLLDTAGRYTTQDSDAERDRAEWTRMLDLLRRYRPQQPLNGLIVVYPVGGLLEADERSVVEDARRIRDRVAEAAETLGVRLPVYLVVTMLDRLQGFSEYFDAQRDVFKEPWGYTVVPRNDDPDRRDAALERYDAEMAALEKRLDEGLPAVLDGVATTRDRVEALRLPSQFRRLREPLRAFLETAFKPDSDDAGGYLRGVYFTSAMEMPSARLSLGRKTVAPALRRSGQLVEDRTRIRGRFVAPVFADVVLKERGLVGESPAARRRARLRAAASVAAGFVLAAGAGAVSFLGARSTLDQHGRAVAVADAAAAAPAGPAAVGVSELLAVADRLDAVARVPEDASALATLTGQDFTDELRLAADGAYARALRAWLRPALVRLAQAEMTRVVRADYILDVAARVPGTDLTEAARFAGACRGGRTPDCDRAVRWAALRALAAHRSLVAPTAEAQGQWLARWAQDAIAREAAPALVRLRRHVDALAGLPWSRSGDALPASGELEQQVAPIATALTRADAVREALAQRAGGPDEPITALLPGVDLGPYLTRDVPRVPAVFRQAVLKDHVADRAAFDAVHAEIAAMRRLARLPADRTEDDLRRARDEHVAAHVNAWIGLIERFALRGDLRAPDRAQVHSQLARAAPEAEIARLGLQANDPEALRVSAILRDEASPQRVDWSSWGDGGQAGVAAAAGEAARRFEDQAFAQFRQSFASFRVNPVADAAFFGRLAAAVQINAPDPLRSWFISLDASARAEAQAATLGERVGRFGAAVNEFAGQCRLQLGDGALAQPQRGRVRPSVHRVAQVLSGPFRSLDEFLVRDPGTGRSTLVPDIRAALAEGRLGGPALLRQLEQTALLRDMLLPAGGTLGSWQLSVLVPALGDAASGTLSILGATVTVAGNGPTRVSLRWPAPEGAPLALEIRRNPTDPQAEVVVPEAQSADTWWLVDLIQRGSGRGTIRFPTGGAGVSVTVSAAEPGLSPFTDGSWREWRCPAALP
jgi:type VI protein secretion system component VasK